MLYEKQRKLFIEAINKAKGLECIDGIILRSIDEWTIENGIEKGAISFPLYIKMEYEVSGKGNMCLILENNEDRTSFDALEILSIDVKKVYQHEGYGEKLINQAKIVMKAFGVDLYGTYMDQDSKEFYKHCGFSINEKSRKFKIKYTKN